jgi:hypothetical protein
MVIMMNQPTNVPDISPQPNWSGNPTDATTFSNSVVANGVSGVFTGGLRVNIRDGYPTTDTPTVPVFVGGGAGAPLGYEKPSQAARAASKLPTDGYYNAWHLVTARPVSSALGARVALDVKTFPIFDSIAMHAVVGRTAAAGNALRFAAMARGLSGGDADPEQSKATYVTIGDSGLVGCDGHGQGYGVCASRDAVNPPYRFWSEDPSIANFVVPDFGNGGEIPALAGPGRPLPQIDGRDGFLCTFKTGSTYINVESGFRRARMKITVEPGFGPCIAKPVKPVVKPVRIEPPFIEEPRPAPKRPYFGADLKEGVAALFPPIPAPIVAPAPPGSPGVGRKEEHEVETEKQGHSEGFEFTALAPGRARAPNWQASFTAVRSSRGHPVGPDPWVILVGLTALSFMSAALAVGKRERRPACERDRAV